jgi:hypothetical protein
MTLKELRNEAWDIARETGTSDAMRLWTTAEMNRYINRVYRFIAKKTRCIRDSMTTSICRITVAPPASSAALSAATDVWSIQDYAWYNDSTSWLYQRLVTPYSFALSPLILRIDEAKWSTVQWKLNKVSVAKWQVNPWWEQVVGTMATEFATDLDNNRIALNFRSTTSDTLKLHVRRMPIADLSADTDSPEFRTEYHDYMINGILAQMYEKQDAQAFDQVKTLDFQARYREDVDHIKREEEMLDSRLKPNNSMDAFR